MHIIVILIQLRKEKNIVVSLSHWQKGIIKFLRKIKRIEKCEVSFIHNLSIYITIKLYKSIYHASFVQSIEITSTLIKRT